MRDGNNLGLASSTMVKKSFWTSYEGWKQKYSDVSAWKTQSFWTSYEGWKLVIHIFHAPFAHEFLNFLWGMETPCRPTSQPANQLVFELPMRDGNESTNAPFTCLSMFLNFLWGMETSVIPKVHIRHALVFELPMRDGNYTSTSANGTYTKMFLNFLWGMETLKYSRMHSKIVQFLNFLWGMETRSF